MPSPVPVKLVDWSTGFADMAQSAESLAMFVTFAVVIALGVLLALATATVVAVGLRR